MEAIFGSASVFVIIFLAILAVCWFLLPFAIFGVKPRLDRIIEELVKANKLSLAKLNS